MRHQAYQRMGTFRGHGASVVKTRIRLQTGFKEVHSTSLGCARDSKVRKRSSSAPVAVEGALCRSCATSVSRRSASDSTPED